MDLATATIEDFRPLVGSTFTVRDRDHPLALVLAAVHAAVAHPGAPRQPFSLDFTGPPAPVLAQQIVTFDHAALGELAIFLVPLGADAGGARYEAVFA